MVTNFLSLNQLIPLQNRSAEFIGTIPFLTLYHRFRYFLADDALRFAMLRIASLFLCSFVGKYFYFVPGEMHI
jgi:hypothetical protein